MPALLILLLGCTKPEPAADPDDGATDPIGWYEVLDFVDPFIGTGGIGAQVTGVGPHASVPHGMVSVGPDTRHSSYGAPGFYHFGGYHYDDDRIDGFSHTHSHGMGVNDYGGVHVMPRAVWNHEWTRDTTRAAPFDHAQEVAAPGSYGVTLGDDGTHVQIAATTHGAVHRYTFPASAEPVVVLDLGHALGDVSVSEAWVDLSLDGFEGYQLLDGSYSGRHGGAPHHFFATVDPPAVATGAWDDPDAPVAGATRGEGTASGGWLAFPPGTTEVTLRLAVSWVDTEGARANHAAELAGSYDTTAAAAVDLWRPFLEAVRIRADDATRRTFHTAHFRTLLMPSRLDDVDGRFRWDGGVHQASAPMYTDYSMWDTFRTLHPWLCLVHPETQAALMQSLVVLTEIGGGVPKWPLATGYTGGMVGTPADQVFAGTWLKGIDGWDVDAAWEASLAHAEGPARGGRAGIEAYVERGWVAFEDVGQPASRQLEYAWSDASLAEWGAALGHTADAERLQARAYGWSNTYDPAQGWAVGRYADGSFAVVEDPDSWQDSYVEGNAWHYRWYVPWDAMDLVTVQHDGDVRAFHATLGEYWDAVYAEPDDDLPDNYYWHGNEPVLHYAALGSLTGEPALTVAPMRWIAENRYGDGPDGLDGNDDAGTLSAWYLFAALGIYPVAGTDRYAVGAPLVARAELDTPSGTVVIRNHITDADAVPSQVKAAREPLDGWVVDHATVLDGLTFE
ncbi:MAG: putative alpha-1,2-mannosidase [Myxococcota bacterium]|jgi:predicted alpha-1,2-mannosidase